MSSVPPVFAQFLEQRHRVITAAEALSFGVSRGWLQARVDSGRWQRVHHGIYLASAEPPTWRQRTEAGLAYARPHAMLSHEAAAFDHGMLRDPPAQIDISVWRNKNAAAPSPGVVIHRRRARVPSTGAPPRTILEDTILDLTDRASTDDEVVGLVAAGFRAGVKRASLLRRLEQRPRVRHRAFLRMLLSPEKAGIESPLEFRYHRDVERAHGLPRSVRQFEQQLPGGGIRSDVAYPKWHVRVELDGEFAHPGRATDADLFRDNHVLIVSSDLTLRYRWYHTTVARCRSAAQVASALMAQGWRGRPYRCGASCDIERWLR